ncbi:MAG: hypothetical protein QXN52_09540, partial [Nitrososphaerota archaeon]
GPPPSLPRQSVSNATIPGQTQISEQFREYQRKLNEISSSINVWSINNHFSTAANMLFYSVTTGPSGQPQQAREISILEALSRSAINIFVMIAFTIFFIILSYISFTRREEK